MVSPDGTGRVPPNQERRLRSIGGWLDRNGEAVYATRALGVREQPAWGYVTRSKTGDRVYCIVRRWPAADGRLVLPAGSVARRARAIGGPANLPVRMAEGRAVVDLSGVRPPDPRASVIVVEVESLARSRDQQR